MTYAAGLNAVTIVWIAERFTEEHRATLDWLNDITSEKFSFIGLEVELWQIDESQIAPKFNVVSTPNDWTRTVASAASKIAGELTETKALQLEYWTALRTFMESGDGRVRPRKPFPQHWTDFAVGRVDFHISAAVNTRERLIRVELVIEGLDAKAHFHLLHGQKEVIEAEVGEPLKWDEKPDRTVSVIAVFWHDTDPADRASWAEQHRWLSERLEKFHAVFSARIQQLDADEYSPEIDDE